MQWTPPLWSFRSHRLKVALALMFAFYVAISMRTTLSMAIVCMVNSTAYAKEEFADLPSEAEVVDDLKHGVVDGCPVRVDENTTAKVGYNGKLLWPPARQTLLFSANYYGAIATTLISGTMADKFGPKKIMIVSVAVLSFITILGPTLAETSYWTFYASRVVMGMAEGFVVPSANSLGGRWFPPSEKSTMAALYTSGNQLAAGSSSFIGSHLCRLPFLGGWPLIFYLFGSLAVVWLVVFIVFVSDYPTDNKWIRCEEKEYLEGRVAQKSHKGGRVPWRAMLTSPAFYACLACNFTFSFCVSITHNFLPLYFKEELFLPLSWNGAFTIIPFLTQLISKNILASLADSLKKSGKMSPTAVVKLFQGLASFGTCFILLLLATLPSCHSPWIAGVLLFAYGVVFSCGICGFFTSLLSIAPAYTGTLSSLSMEFGQFANIFSTNTVTFITYMNWPHKWFIVFAIGAVLQIITGIIFLFFGQGEAQEWAKLDRPVDLSMVGESLTGNFGMTDTISPYSLPKSPLSDDVIDDGHLEEILPSDAKRRRIDAIRKESREAALVRWTLSSPTGTHMIEEEDEDNVEYFLNGKLVS